MTRGELAKQTGVNIETLRYYERRGILKAPPRTASGYRQYSEDTVVRIQFVKRCQDLGFSLQEITELLALRVDSATTCDDVRERAADKLANTEQKMLELQRIKAALQKMIASCDEKEPTGECPILEALEQSVGKEIK